MNKRTETLDTIRDKYLTTRDKPCVLFLCKVWIHYLQTDLETGDQLADIFFALYISQERYTFDEIAYRFSIGLTTLNRYRKRFNALAEKFLLSE